MCGRYTLSSPATQIEERFGVPVPVTLPKRFNIAPSQLVLAVRDKPSSDQSGPSQAHDRELVALQWGFVPFWADDPEIGSRMINARSETAATKSAFRASFRSRRCLVIADGFYEWQARNGHKQPYYVRLKSGLPFGIAGLWDRWDKHGEPIESCTILTCPANEPMSVIHERMPVVIQPESFDLWLDPDVRDSQKLSRLLRPFHPDEMTAYPVSTLVNNVRINSSAFIEPLKPDGGDS